LLLAGVVAWTWYSMKTQEWLGPLGLSQLRITALTSLVSVGTLLGAFLLAAALGLAHAPDRMPGGAALAMLLWVGVGGAGIAIYLWNFGASRIGVPVATIYGNMAPVFAIVVAHLFGAPITLQQVLGGTLVLAGVIQMQVRRLRQQRLAFTDPAAAFSNQPGR
jgi:drug/metabolite transporter (DMT)-like permease